MERMKTKIEIGKSYLNREGIIMDVIKQVDYNSFLVTNKNGNYNYDDYGNGYIVTMFGGFGNTPNYRDLINMV
jgi:hypothetical protein